MGETGCGKTRLVKFLCDLQLHNVDVFSKDDTKDVRDQKKADMKKIRNLFLVKV